MHLLARNWREKNAISKLRRDRPKFIVRPLGTCGCVAESLESGFSVLSRIFWSQSGIWNSPEIWWMACVRCHYVNLKFHLSECRSSIACRDRMINQKMEKKIDVRLNENCVWWKSLSFGCCCVNGWASWKNLKRCWHEEALLGPLINHSPIMILNHKQMAPIIHSQWMRLVGFPFRIIYWFQGLE